MSAIGSPPLPLLDILLVEDDPDHAALAMRAFAAARTATGAEAGNWSVRHAASLAQADALLREAAPRLVIMDAHLPDGNGVDFLAARQGQAHLPWLLVTALGDEALAVRAMKSGALDYLVKTPEMFAQLPVLAQAALRQWDERQARLAAEAALREANETLERRVRERTEQLMAANALLLEEASHRKAVCAQLDRARADAETAYSAKSEFLAAMTLEIRTPMNAILGMADLLGLTALDAEQEEYLASIRASAQGLLESLNQILEFSRVDARQAVPRREPFVVRAILQSALAPLGEVAMRRDLALLWDLDPEVPEILVGDGARLRQVLLHLAGVAVRHVRSGGVRVQASLEPEAVRLPDAPRRAALRLRLRDTGPGLAPDLLVRLREAMAAGEQVLARQFGGLGLGVIVSKRLAEFMGGGLAVASPPDAGALFTVTAMVELPDSEPEAVCAAASPGCAPSLRILLAEDHALAARATSRALERLGHQVTLATSGAEAVALFRERSWHLVFLDLHMPPSCLPGQNAPEDGAREVDGLEAAREMRALETAMHRDYTPIVALTAFSSRGDAAGCLKAGMDAVLAKPACREDLQAILQRFHPLSGPVVEQGAPV